jgi:hypothetical protein
MAQKDIQKLIQKMQGKKKKPVVKTARTAALEGRKHFSAGTNPMIKQAQKNYDGSYISGDLGGVKVGNKSYAKYYKGMV